jgi:hypothetical protein
MDEIRTPAEDDAAAESAVLGMLLELHPAPISFEELLREIAGGPADFAQRDALGRAVRELAAAGLLHRNGDLVLPSRAAVRFDELLGD